MNSQDPKNTLFVSDLPQGTILEDLAEFFKNYHFIYASLTRSKSSTWAKAIFETEEYANLAKNELNGDILIPKSYNNPNKPCPIRICSFERQGASLEKNINQSLLVKNLDKRMTQKEFYQIFLKFGEIDSAKINYEDDGISKGFGYIYYRTPESAELAKQNLNGKEYYGKKIDIVNLIPTKSKDFSNSLFVKNFPSEFTESDLKKIFERFGEVKSVSINKDQSGHSKCYGFISFTSFDMTSRCIAEIKQNEISFQGLPPLVVKNAARKEDREHKGTGVNYTSEFLKMQFNFIYATGEIENQYDLEKEIRLFIKVVMLQDYNPKDVIVDFTTYGGIVTFHTRKDFEEYLKKYEEFCSTRAPSFECLPVKVEIQHPMLLNHHQQQNPHHPNMNPMMMNKNNNNQQMNMNGVQNNTDIHPHMNMGMPIPMEIPVQIPINNYENNNPNNHSGFPNMVLVPGSEIQQQPNQNQMKHFRNMPINPQLNMPVPVGFQRQPLPGNMKRPAQQPNQPQQGVFMDPMMNIQMWPQGILRPPFHQNPQQMLKMMNPQLQIQQQQGQPPINKMPGNPNMMPNPYMFNPMDLNFNNALAQQKKRNEDIDQRNLQNLDARQLKSQFGTPAQHIFDPELFDVENEEIANEIADSIYEIVHSRYPA